MIIQTAPSGTPRLAIMMYEHNALCLQFAHAFGNAQFEPLSPNDLMIHVVSHHDAGWIDFDRNPKIDPATGLPYNLVETPPEFITTTSRLSPDFNQRQHPYCGLISSMHSWGLYNGRYGLSKLVLLDNIAAKDRPLADKMLNGELDRQKRLKAELATDPETRALARRTQDFPELQGAAVPRHARALLQSNPPQRAGRAVIRKCSAFAGAGRDGDDTPGRSEHLSSVSVSARREWSRICLLRTARHACGWQPAWRVAGGVARNSGRMGVFPLGGWLNTS